MALRTGSFLATFARGGTSNGLVILASQLPKDRAQWQPILSSAMGSPDKYGRQLNGMGSGLSSTSKICVLERSERPNVDIDFTFVQVGIKDGTLDLAGNCGNMSAVVGPVALNEGLVSRGRLFKTEAGEDVATVRVLNTNTSKMIHATFATTASGQFKPSGSFSIDGVPGQASRITLSFLDPAGAKTGKALPTGNAVDTLELPDSEGGPIEASLVDVANPGVFVRASDLGVDGAILPDELQANTKLMSRLEAIRRKGAELMGLDPNIQSIPKIVLLSTPDSASRAEGVQIQVRALSMQLPHKAFPGTHSLNLGAACNLPGTLPNQIMITGALRESITIGHPTGKIQVGCVMKDGVIESALLHRTARILMKGQVYYTVPEPNGVLRAP